MSIIKNIALNAISALSDQKECSWCGKKLNISGRRFCGTKCSHAYEYDKEFREEKKLNKKNNELHYEGNINNSKTKKPSNKALSFLKFIIVIFILFCVFVVIAVNFQKNDTFTTNTEVLQKKSEQELSPSPSFIEGRNARKDWEDWFGSLSGDSQNGALFWAKVRSQKTPPNCDGSLDFAKACFEAKKRLSLSDARRNSDPEFKAGWNSL